MAEIRLSKMGNTRHLHEGNKDGRPRKKIIKEETKEGFFNVSEYNCWLLGFSGHQKNTANESMAPSKTYHLPKGNTAKRYF